MVCRLSLQSEANPGEILGHTEKNDRRISEISGQLPDDTQAEFVQEA